MIPYAIIRTYALHHHHRHASYHPHAESAYPFFSSFGVAVIVSSTSQLRNRLTTVKE